MRSTFIIYIYIVHTLPETNMTSPLKIDGLEDESPFGAWPIFRGELLVSGSVTCCFQKTPRFNWKLFSFC